ncbi:MAG: anthranilate phosphoribosyltransferase [Leptolyngbya sp. PLA1]|nr:anthranilate phosphoribosyltransferase [Leptolyngbya sp. PLA1]
MSAVAPIPPHVAPTPAIPSARRRPIARLAAATARSVLGAPMLTSKHTDHPYGGCGMNIRETLSKLLAGGTLSAAESRAFFEDLLEGLYDDAQIGAALALIQRRLPTEDEILGGAMAMRRHVTPVPSEGLSGAVVDTCGTGGARKTFNISTLAAIVTAAAAPHAVRVAKHGNRGRSGRGSAELLRELGVNIDATPPVQGRCLREIGLCFCFAIHHHPAMRHASTARQSLGFPTIFNVLGPLTNPAKARRQVMGIYDPALVEPVARVLSRLGCERAMVVHGRDGIDEISTAAPTMIAHVTPEKVELEEFSASSLGISRASSADLDAADLRSAAAIARAVLDGEHGPPRDITLLNAAAALLVGGAAQTWAESLVLAARAVDTGAATRVLTDLIRLSHEPA